MENNDWLSLLNGFFPVTIRSDRYLPYRAGYNWYEYSRIASTNPIVKKAVDIRKAAVGANGWEIVCKAYRSEKRNEDLSWQIYNILEKAGVEKMIKDYSVMSSIYGNSYFTFNNDNEGILHAPYMYELYWNYLEDRPWRYALTIDGIEQKGLLGNLQHGRDIWHFKNPSSSYKPLADSPIQACYDWILFYQHAIEANNILASRGWVNTIFLLPENDPQTNAFLEKKDDKGKTGAQVMVDRLMNWFGGINKSSRVGVLNRIREIVEAGKTNREMQFVETQDTIIEHIAFAFGLSSVDLGKDATYNTASTFSYAQYDVFGRAEELEFARMVNNFWLKKLAEIYNLTELANMIDRGDIYFKFNEPKDPDEVANLTLQMQIMEKMLPISTNTEYKAKIVNEFRDRLGLDPIDEKLFEVEEVVQPGVKGQTLDVEVEDKESFFAQRIEQFAKPKIKTPTQQAVESQEFERTEKDGSRKGFLPHLENKIAQQLNIYAEDFAKKKV